MIWYKSEYRKYCAWIDIYVSISILSKISSNFISNFISNMLQLLIKMLFFVFLIQFNYLNTFAQTYHIYIPFNTIQTCQILTAMVFSLIPPTGSTFPVRDISPVMAMFCLTGLSIARDSRAVTRVQPALGPSLGVEPWKQRKYRLY